MREAYVLAECHGHPFAEKAVVSLSWRLALQDIVSVSLDICTTWRSSNPVPKLRHTDLQRLALYLGHPQFEGFEVRQTIGARKKANVAA